MSNLEKLSIGWRQLDTIPLTAGSPGVRLNLDVSEYRSVMLEVANPPPSKGNGAPAYGDIAANARPTAVEIPVSAKPTRIGPLDVSVIQAGYYFYTAGQAVLSITPFVVTNGEIEEKPVIS
jgi:hypothetical protein